jgi:hypothetical protein
MNSERCIVKNERGSAIVAALLILTLLTIIGIAAINSSSVERSTSANYLLYERVFFTAETGLEHAKAALQNKLRDQIPLLATGQRPKFSFALSQTPNPATNYFPGHLGDPTAADFTGFGKNVQVAINGAEADAGEPLAHHFINFVGAGMSVDLAQFLQDHPALARDTHMGLLQQNFEPSA